MLFVLGIVCWKVTMPAMYFETAEQKKSVCREGESNMENTDNYSI